MSRLRQKYELILAQAKQPSSSSNSNSNSSSDRQPPPQTQSQAAQLLQVQRRQQLNVIRKLVLLEGLPQPLTEVAINLGWGEGGI